MPNRVNVNLKIGPQKPRTGHPREERCRAKAAALHRNLGEGAEVGPQNAPAEFQAGMLSASRTQFRPDSLAR